MPVEEVAGGLAGRVIREIERLKGVVPDDFAPAERVVDTLLGPRRLPVGVQALAAVRWSDGSLRTDDEFEKRIELSAGHAGDDELFSERRAWWVIGRDHWHDRYVVDLDDEDGHDPTVYRSDGCGDEPYGWHLSAVLAGLTFIPPATPADRFARQCASGDVAAVTAALPGGPPLGPLDDSGLTPLHLAVLSRSPALVRALLAAGADPTASIVREASTPWRFVDQQHCRPGTLPAGSGPLHLALDVEAPRPGGDRAANVEIVGILLAAGTDPNATNERGQTPLHLECRGRGGGEPAFDAGTAIVELLLGNGADPNIASPIHGTPLTLVAGNSRDVDVAVVRLLLAAGADPHLHAPLAKALYGGEAPVRLLLAAGADPGRPSTLTQYDVSGPTPLHQATLFGRGELLTLLLAHASDPDVRTTGGVTPLHFAVALPPARDSTHAVDLLLAAGADVNAHLPNPAALAPGLTAHTPLAIARELGKPTIAAALQQAGALES
ncbi:ankyrin repeat domain-containing protein [Dactylosporangium sp. CA-092794]|uniref:ankyrin repeat domain-containing protein n=1 Tax=Dactylosporangium sp. CA-092794 TaxID=3239929 RepID=UPI003D8E6657